MKILHLVALAWFCALPLTASAQWQWVDNQGKKVFSDQPPPADIPDKNIVRRAGPAAAQRGLSDPGTAAAPEASAASSPARPAASAAKAAGVDKELEEKTRKAEAAEKAKQAAEAEKLAKAKADNCARARQGKATFDSGIRVARVNSKGEREIMDDKTRASENRRLQSVIDSDCK